MSENQSYKASCLSLKSNPERREWMLSIKDKMGLDFKIYEGNNTIGRDASNTITIIGDPAVSSKHATIMFRVDNKFYIKDGVVIGNYQDGKQMRKVIDGVWKIG